MCLLNDFNNNKSPKATKKRLNSCKNSKEIKFKILSRIKY